MGKKAGGVDAGYYFGEAAYVEDVTIGEIRDCNADSWIQVEISKRLVETVAGVFGVDEDCARGVVLFDTDEARVPTAVVGGHVGRLVRGSKEEVGL